jgi:SAM-dependent methyltransferase
MSSDAERIIGLYQRKAHEWARDRAIGNSLFEKPWLDRFRSLLPSGGSILDIGCGSGEPIAGYFIGEGYEVTGVDSSPALVELCKARFPGQRWLVADMRTLSLGRRFEGLLAWDSFFHLAPHAQREMFLIFQKHAASRAALMFTSGPASGEALGSYEGEPLYHASLDSDEYASLLDGAGFDVASHVVEDPSCGHHTIWLARAAAEPRS